MISSLLDSLMLEVEEKYMSKNKTPLQSGEGFWYVLDGIYPRSYSIEYHSWEQEDSETYQRLGNPLFCFILSSTINPTHRVEDTVYHYEENSSETRDKGKVLDHVSKHESDLSETFFDFTVPGCNLFSIFTTWIFSICCWPTICTRYLCCSYYFDSSCICSRCTCSSSICVCAIYHKSERDNCEWKCDEAEYFFHKYMLGICKYSNENCFFSIYFQLTP